MGRHVGKHNSATKRPKGRPRGMGPIKHDWLVSLVPTYLAYKERGQSSLFYSIALAMWLMLFKDTGKWGLDPLVRPKPLPKDLKITPISKKHSRKAPKKERKLHMEVRKKLRQWYPNHSASSSSSNSSANAIIKLANQIREKPTKGVDILDLYLKRYGEEKGLQQQIAEDWKANKKSFPIRYKLKFRRSTLSRLLKGETPEFQQALEAEVKALNREQASRQKLDIEARATPEGYAEVHKEADALFTATVDGIANLTGGIVFLTIVSPHPKNGEIAVQSLQSDHTKGHAMGTMAEVNWKACDAFLRAAIDYGRKHFNVESAVVDRIVPGYEDDNVPDPSPEDLEAAIERQRLQKEASAGLLINIASDNEDSDSEFDDSDEEEEENDDSGEEVGSGEEEEEQDEEDQGDEDEPNPVKRKGQPSNPRPKRSHKDDARKKVPRGWGKPAAFVDVPPLPVFHTSPHVRSSKLVNGAGSSKAITEDPSPAHADSASQSRSLSLSLDLAVDTPSPTTSASQPLQDPETRSSLPSKETLPASTKRSTSAPSRPSVSSSRLSSDTLDVPISPPTDAPPADDILATSNTNMVEPEVTADGLPVSTASFALALAKTPEPAAFEFQARSAREGWPSSLTKNIQCIVGSPSRDLPSPMDDIMDCLVKYEECKGFPLTGPKFNASSGEPRLIEFVDWMKDKRRATTPHDLNRKTIGERWLSWWKYLQPKSRVPDDAASRLTRSFDIKFTGSGVDQAGPNGVALVVIGLAWWWDSIPDENNSQMSDWYQAAFDVRWVFRRLVAQTQGAGFLPSSSTTREKSVNSSKATTGKRKTTSPIPKSTDTDLEDANDQPSRKRRRLRKVPDGNKKADEPAKKGDRATGKEPNSGKATHDAPSSKKPAIRFGRPSKRPRLD